MTTRKKVSSREVIGPKSRKQEMFIQSPANITVFGGAAGAGKSFLGVLDIATHCHLKNYKAIITRLTNPQLRGPGGILDKCTDLFSKVFPKAKWKDKDGKWVFPSGAQVFLKHFELEKDKENFDGVEVNTFLVDEGQQYSKEKIMYLMSRMRNPTCPEVQPYMKITCNPKIDSFLRDWVLWYLDPETGIPDPTKDGILRYFIMRNGDLVWADTLDEMYEKHGIQGIDRNDPRQIKPLSFTFISANVYDNPVVVENNPDYVAWLEGLPRVERERLLLGSWNAREESEGYFKREWCEIVDRPPLNADTVRAWDFAGTLPSEAYPNPDYTVGLKMSRCKDTGEIYIEDLTRFRDRWAGVLETVFQTAKEDGKDIVIGIPQDPGVAGKAQAQSLVQDLANRGYYAKVCRAETKKLTRFRPFIAVSEAKKVKVVRGEWNEIFFKELEEFDGSRNKKDDIVDTVSDGFMLLNSVTIIPTFRLPDMKQANPFNFN